MTFTVLGSSGFIGRALVDYLLRRGEECHTPARDEWRKIPSAPGHVVYCVGITADFRSKPLETARAHVCRLLEILERRDMQSFLYLSSTRVYGGADHGGEDAMFRVDPNNLSDTYNLSKLMGESLCLAMTQSTFRVARVSNVYGSDWTSENFLMAVIRESVDAGRLQLRTGYESTKDYIAIGSVAALLARIATAGRSRIYNVASGVNVTNRQIGAALTTAAGTVVDVDPAAPTIGFPPIAVDRIRDEFGFTPEPVLDAIPHLVDDYKEWKRHDHH